MNISRRDFMKMVGAMTASLSVSPGDIVLPKGPVVATVMPQVTPGRTDAGKFHVVSMYTEFLGIGREVTTLGHNSYWERVAADDIVSIDLSIITDSTGAIMLNEWFRDQQTLPFWHHEWLCVYCGTAQPIWRNACPQCGGTRDWVVE